MQSRNLILTTLKIEDFIANALANEDMAGVLSNNAEFILTIIVR